jgi:hypothetical protein
MPDISSRSPSIVSSAVLVIAAQHTLAPAARQQAARQQMVLEHGCNRLQVVIGGHVHHRLVFLVERLRAGQRFAIAFHQMLDHPPMRLDMAIEIHGHETRKLQKSRIYTPQKTGIAPRHAVDDVAAEPLQRMPPGEGIHLGGRLARIDRAADQCDAARAGGVAGGSQQRRGSEHRHGGLTHGNHMDIRAGGASR